MTELYVNKQGFKCVPSQLAKTSGIDPVEYATLEKQHAGDNAALKQAVKGAKVRDARFKEE